MKILAELNSLPRPFVLAIVTNVEGSAPGKTGFKMAIFPDGQIKGTVGGGDIERNAIEFAKNILLEKQKPQIKTFIMNQVSKAKGDEVRTGMICGGSSSIYFEPFSTADRVIFWGGGHITQALAPLMSQLGYQVAVCDNRPEYATADRYPRETKIRIGDYEKLAKETECDENTYCLILTHGHAHDAIVLESLLNNQNEAKYIGMIGSKTKVKLTIEKMKMAGVREDRLKKVYTPVGLPIGGETPMEIALSIAAEIQATKFGKSVAHMRVN